MRFNTVRSAIDSLNITSTTSLERCALVWSDSVGECKIFHLMKPWQMINRIPSAHVLCRKATLAYIVCEVTKIRPDVYGMIFPRTFIVPMHVEEAMTYQRETGKRMLFKPDWASLGKGIEFIEGGRMPAGLGVAQEYIPSYLIDNRKFDLRVYCLVASLSPLRIYVFRDGIARFCSEDATSDSIFAHVTNVGLNQRNTNGNYSTISRLISEVMPLLAADGVDIVRLWREIEDAIGLTVFAAFRYLASSEREFVPNCGYSRCFQIFGFDILLDRAAHPWVLEVNYRPLLEFHRPCERRMKVQMIREAIQIACPHEIIQTLVDAGGGIDALDDAAWKEFWDARDDLKEILHRHRSMAEVSSKWSCVWPAKGTPRQAWFDIAKLIQAAPFGSIPGIIRVGVRTGNAGES